MTTTASYGYTKTLRDVSYEQALERVTAALKDEGFGVLTEIDVKATLKKKIDVDFRNYKILGACNPPLAHRALSGEPLIGLLLPCNVTVFEEDDGTINVSFIKPSEMFKIVDNPQVGPIAKEVDAKLVRAMEKL
jgi:uncharacterized protein (DUF302 family)